MADQVQEIIEVPKEFLKDGLQFISKSQKRKCDGFFLIFLSPGTPDFFLFIAVTLNYHRRGASGD